MSEQPPRCGHLIDTDSKSRAGRHVGSSRPRYRGNAPTRGRTDPPEALPAPPLLPIRMLSHRQSVLTHLRGLTDSFSLGKSSGAA